MMKPKIHINEPKVAASTTLPQSDFDKIEQIAGNTGRNRSQIIAMLVKYALYTYEQQGITDPLDLVKAIDNPEYQLLGKAGTVEQARRIAKSTQAPDNNKSQ